MPARISGIAAQTYTLVKSCQKSAWKDLVISTSDGVIFFTPARASRTMIQMANSTVVRIIVLVPNPKSVINTGTRAVNGALRNILTQGSSIRSITIERPIKTPIGMPTTIAIAVPIRKHLAVIHSAFINVAVGITSNILIIIWLNGGRSIDSSS